MEAVAAALEGFALAEWLRYSRWSYAIVSAAHIFGIALLVGSVLPLNLRLLGLWPSVELGPLYRVLSRIAGTGLLLAAVSGLLLFASRATEYAVLDLFIVKMMLVAAGTVLAAIHHFGTDLANLGRSRQRLVGVLSLLFWPAALVCGRLLAFV